MEKKRELITIERIYITRIKARLVKNAEGWYRMEDVPPYQPTGIEFVDRLARVLANTTSFSEKSILSALDMDEEEARFFIKYYMGMNLKELANTYRLLVAKEYLSHTDLIVKEIADRCGYGSREGFTRIFTKRTGYSPGSYRNQKRPSNFRQLYRW